MTDDIEYDGYLANSQLRWAVERQLSIVGEALYQLRDEFPSEAAKVPESKGIINFRHVLVHGYSVIENEAVWAIIRNRLPALQDFLEDMLRE
jgi:uncharacterized protein with HEPN domain